MVSVEFARPVFLWLTLLIPLLFIAHYYFLYRTQKKAMSFANFETIKRIAGERFVTKNITVLALRFFVLLCAIIVLSGMTIYYEGERNNFDYVIAIDTSTSMLTTDIEPDRLTAAKVGASRFLDTLNSESAVGLVTFSGITYVRNPLSTEYLNMRVNIELLNVSRASGTDLSGAVISSANLFRNDNVGKAIILFTDGSNTVSAFIENGLEETAAYALKEQIVIHAIGLGTDDAPVGYLPESFNLSASVDKDALEILTSRTGGQVVYPETQEELNSFFQDLNQLSTTGNIPYDTTRPAVLIMVALLSIEWILISLIFRRVA